MEMSEKIKYLRKQNNLTLEEVGKIVGVGKSTVRKWESGEIANMRRDKIAKLAQALNTTPAYLMGWSEEPDISSSTISNVVPFPKTRQVPIVGSIACGLPILAEENIEGYAAMPEDIKADFALRCVGDSMVGARICDGDIVYIHQTSEFHNGEICAVLVDSDEATLKRVYRISNSLLELRAENPAYPIQRYEGEQLCSVRIIGRAVAFTSVVRH